MSLITIDVNRVDMIVDWVEHNSNFMPQAIKVEITTKANLHF